MRRRLSIAVTLLRRHGFRVLMREARRAVHKRIGTVPIRLSVALSDVLAADLTQPAATSSTAARQPVKRSYIVSWVLPPLGPASGGHQTAFRFIDFLQSRGHRCRAHFYDPQRIQSKEELARVLSEHYPPIAFEIEYGLARLSEADAIFATSWQTAYPVYNAPGHAVRFYFVQDFEPCFYPVGTESVLAENTYRLRLNGITAGRWLSERLSREFGMRCDYFDFGSDPERYVYRNAGRRKKVIFYARPVTPRRGFELGVLALQLFSKRNPKYELALFGWDVSEYRLPFRFVNYGVLPPADLNRLYNDAAAALVLSFTNMSLLPLELLSAGCIPVVNDALNNRMVSDNEHIVYEQPTPHALAAALERVVCRPDLPDYSRAASESVKRMTWERACQQLESSFLRVMQGPDRPC